MQRIKVFWLHALFLLRKNWQFHRLLLLENTTMPPTFLGIDSNGWLAIVGGAYAGATFLLARVTNNGSIRAAASAKDIADAQNGVTSRAVGQQIENAARGVALQIRASAEQQEHQAKSTREAAVIQARAGSVSNNRQAWINSLRDEVTGFLSEAQIDPFMNEFNDPSRDDAAEAHPNKVRRLRSYIFKIRLLINPSEGESTALVSMLEKALQNGLTARNREEIVRHTQSILKTEWERVKSGD